MKRVSEDPLLEHVSRVAELLFVEDPLWDFARTISDLEAALNRICGQQPRLQWDCDDVASFDMPGIRILLSQAESPYPGFAARLVVSVGPSPIAPLPDRGTMVHASVCVRLVNRLRERFFPDDLRWNDILGVVTAEDVDLLAEGLTRRETRQKRPEIFTPDIGTSADCDAALRSLRTALHPYSPRADLPAAWTRAANSAVDLAAAMAVLPATAMHFAANWYRMASR